MQTSGASRRENVELYFSVIATRWLAMTTERLFDS
jgi:hypothetical protein